MRLAVFGLDSVSLPLMHRLKGHMPFLSSWIDSGYFKQVRSCDPPITIPAWSVLTTGKDPGELGVYGFNRRLSRDSLEADVNSSAQVIYPRIWQLLPQGKNSFVWGVPQTYPHYARPGSIQGGCILNGSRSADYVFPPEVAGQYLELFQDKPLFDISAYRSTQLRRIHQELDSMLTTKDRIFSQALKQSWDMFFGVLIETDRLHHVFYAHTFSDHPRFVPDSPYREVLPAFYARLDRMLAGWVQLALAAGMEPVILSDHGIRPLHGIFAINEWLIDNGYLKLRNGHPEGNLRFELIDLARTQAYAQGGYCGRIYFNVVGRETKGTVTDVLALADKMRTELEADLGGRSLSIQWLQPENIYQRVAGIAPDALLYVDDLNYRVSSGVFSGKYFYDQNDTGPDGVNHDVMGVFGSRLNSEAVHSIQDVFAWMEGLI